ncbi:MAG: hypothetical protein HW419_3211 [Deltaproteobacteria bacterium]|nr:hypothetical protein [Deltaproteobacteria bacterium]
MKIILSRKGFDSAAGGVPSPIFPNGTMVSLPIPGKHSPIRYQDIRWNGNSLGPIVSDLTGGRIGATRRAHFDPDLNHLSLTRQNEWRPLFGQASAAQVHLENQNVEQDDIFLFYGLFRKVVEQGGRLKFDANEHAKHVIWGWLQIDRIIKVDSCDKNELAWAMYHPHFNGISGRTNTVYIAKDKFTGLGSPNLSGAGVFACYDARLQLTQPGSTKVSIWQLPKWFYPGRSKKYLSYHGDRDRWSRTKSYTILRTVARGQEFVLHHSNDSEAKSWLRTVLSVRIQ